MFINTSQLDFTLNQNGGGGGALACVYLHVVVKAVSTEEETWVEEPASLDSTRSAVGATGPSRDDAGRWGDSSAGLFSRIERSMWGVEEQRAAGS